MRSTSLLRGLISISNTFVTGYSAEDGALVVRVRPSWRLPRCSGCGRKCPPGFVVTKDRRWQHLDLAGVRLFLSCDVRRVHCTRCGDLVERFPWAPEPRARFTEDLDDHVTYLAQRCDRTAVERATGISWRSVGNCIERAVERRRPADPLAGLQQIGVDELSYRKHHKYLTLVADLVEGRIVWGKEGKDAATLKAFFDELGEERLLLLETICSDMSGAYISAINDVRKQAPDLEHVYDRFHVQALVSKALVETRREEGRRLRGTDEEQTVKRSRWALLKRPVHLTEAESAKLAEIQKSNRGLYRGYLITAQFRDILDRRQHNVVRALLKRWCGWCSRSRLPAFVKVARTIRDHMDGIVAYIHTRATNGLIEGLNNKARLLTRRAYGFHSAEAALAMIMLCCSGIDIRPVRKLIY